jgi:hypothetical protein
MNNPFEREAFSNEDNLDYLKIDCEGGEYDFLMNIDLSNVRYMAIEIHTQLGNDKIKELNNHLLQYFTIINDLNDGINMHKELTLKNKSI